MNSSSLPLVAQSPLDRLGKAGPGLPALLSWWSWKKSPQPFSLYSQTRDALKQQGLSSLGLICVRAQQSLCTLQGFLP